MTAEAAGVRLRGAGDVELRGYPLDPGQDGVEPVAAGVVVVHGKGEHAGRYEPFARYLAGRGFAVTRYDQRGHGRSGGRRGGSWPLERYLADLDRVVDDLRLRAPVIFLFGHSFGGLVVLRWLQTRPPSAREGLRGAVLSAPWLGTALPLPGWKLAAARVLLRLAPGLPLSTDVHPELLTSDEALQEAYRRDPLVHHRISPGFYHAVLDAQAEALAARTPSDTPLLVLLPGEDRISDVPLARRWAEGLEGPVRIQELPGMRHEPLNEVGRERVFALVAEWMAARLPAEPMSEGRV